MLPGVVGAKRGQKGQQRWTGGGQRFALIVFVAVFVLLFVGFAIAQGIGGPSVPAGDVAVVREVPGDLGNVSEEDFDVALEQQAAQAKLKKTPKPGDKKYNELKEAALGELLNEIWLEGEAEELGITVTDKQVETELKNIKKQSFPSEGAYQKFLKESHYTQEDVDQRVRLQMYTTQIQEGVNSSVAPPTKSEIAAYYEAEKAEKYSVKETRDVRVVVNKDKAKVEAAKEELDKENSPAIWKKVAKKYSSDPTTKTKGGLQPGISEEFISQEPLRSAIFDSPKNELMGPLKVEKNYLLLEIVKINPPKIKPLSEVQSEIKSTLTQEAQQEVFGEFVTAFQAKWEGRTECASAFLIEQCGNFKGTGLPEGAPPACFEADPKTPTSECPAPVPLTQPALPGSVSSLKPKGEQLVQRPFPSPTSSASEEAAGAPEGASEVEPNSSGE
jgi:parvulin-like peptidyl-prolyl isomerase